jgi:hypothetical protein
MKPKLIVENGVVKRQFFRPDFVATYEVKKEKPLTRRKKKPKLKG